MLSDLDGVFVQDDPKWTKSTIIGGDMELHAYEITNGVKTPEDLDKYLVQYPEYDLRSGGRCGWTVLASAIKMRSLELVRHILKLRPDLVNSCFGYYNTPLLHYAIVDLRIFCEFIMRGANIHLVDVNNESALFTATASVLRDKVDINIIKYLLRNHVTVSESLRQRIMHDDTYDSMLQADVLDQPNVVRHAYKVIQAEDMFLEGYFNCPLPYELRLIIWEFMIYPMPAGSNR
jgi:hypothetical protein